MIRREDVEKMRVVADLYSIVSATVMPELSGIGASMDLCPFHDEKVGNFNVCPSLGV